MSTLEPFPRDRLSRNQKSSAVPVPDTGVAVLCLVALLLLAATVFVGLPAIDDLRKHSGCVAVTDGSFSARETCGG